MAAKWGVLLCDCLQTLSIDPRRLDVPTPCVRLTHHAETAVRELAALVEGERPDRVLIGCGAPPHVFEDALRAAGATAPTLHFVNLKESCFRVHADAESAHAKASRLVRAAMQTAELQAEPAYNRLTAGDRILIAADTAQGYRLATQLGDVARPFLVIDAGGAPGFESFPPRRVYRGRVCEVTGRLGDFRVRVQEAARAATRELQADQVVIMSRNGHVPVKGRTGCHLLTTPDESEMDQVAQRVRDLIGNFLKVVHVSYRADICAGGTADQEACGRCIPACPYDAIRRDPAAPLRIQVDHMSCEGCGACVSACPTSALRFAEPSPVALYTRLTALLAPLSDGRCNAHQLVLFHCGEQGKRVLEEAGRQALAYAADVVPVEVPCLRYVSEANILAAFRLGAAGVGLLGCDTCRHGERQLLYEQLDFCRLTLAAFAFGPDRVRLITATDGAAAEAIATVTRFAESVAAAPLPSHAQPLRHTDNRGVIEESLAAFMAHTGYAPGRRTFHAPHAFAFAEVEAAGCTLCRSCVNVCPVHAFKLDDATSSLQYKHLACVACGLCETVCPEHVIRLHHEVYFEPEALDYQTVVQDDMVACGRCGKAYINRKALDTIEARVLSLDSRFDTFSGRRRDLLRLCPDCRAVAAMLEVERGWEP